MKIYSISNCSQILDLICFTSFKKFSTFGVSICTVTTTAYLKVPSQNPLGQFQQ